MLSEFNVPVDDDVVEFCNVPVVFAVESLFSVPVCDEVDLLPIAAPLHPLTQFDAQVSEQFAPHPDLHPP